MLQCSVGLGRPSAQLASMGAGTAERDGMFQSNCSILVVWDTSVLCVLGYLPELAFGNEFLRHITLSFSFRQQPIQIQNSKIWVLLLLTATKQA